MTRLRKAALALAVATGLLAATGSASAAAHHHGNVTCHRGTVAAGTYRSLAIAGSCTLASSGTVTVRHDLVIRRAAFFNAATAATLVYHAIALWIPGMWGTIAFLLLRRSRGQPLRLRPPRAERKAAQA